MAGEDAGSGRGLTWAGFRCWTKGDRLLAGGLLKDGDWGT